MAFPATTARYLLFLFNLIILVSGVAVAVIALLIQVSFFQHSLFLKTNLWSPPMIIAIACGIICLISLFGCCGVIKESRCVLLLFSSLLFFVFIVEVAVGIYIYQSSDDDIGYALQTKMKNTMKDYNKIDTVTKSWNVLQSDFHCCGITNATDWISVMNKLPEACCNDIPIYQDCTLKDANKQGCLTLFQNFVQSQAFLLAGVAVGVGVTQLFCSVASGLLARHINKQYEAV